MRVCLKSIKKIIPNLVEVISSSDYIFPGVVKKRGVFFLASIVNTSFFCCCLFAFWGFLCAWFCFVGFFLSCEIRISII